MFFLWTPKNMKFSFTFLFRFLFLCSFHALLGICFYGCAGNQVVSSTKEIASEDNTEPSIKNIEFQGDLKGKLQAVGFTQGVVNDDLVKIQVRLENLTKKEINLNYKFEWLDEKKFVIKDSALAWSALYLRGGEIVNIQSVASSSRAKNFYLKIQKAKHR